MRKKGSILVLTLFMGTILVLLGGLFLQMTVGNIMLVERENEKVKGYWVAKAGLSKAIYYLRTYYFHHQEDAFEEPLGDDAKYKVAIVTLISDGYHKSIITSTGITGLKTPDFINRKSIIASVSMNTFTDYANFWEGNAGYWQDTVSGPVQLS